MNTLTKLALGAMGQLHSKPAQGDATPKIALPVPGMTGGMPLMEALSKRQSVREFTNQELPLALLSNLLWAANGVNRPDKTGRTAPSAMNAQEIDIYVALPAGAYLYDAAANALQLVAGSDLRRITGYQDFVDDAALDLVLVADHSRMKLVPAASRESYASVAAGAVAQNVYLFAAGNGLATVIRAWISRDAIAAALGLGHDIRSCCHRPWALRNANPRGEITVRTISTAFRFRSYGNGQASVPAGPADPSARRRP